MPSIFDHCKNYILWEGPVYESRARRPARLDDTVRTCEEQVGVRL